MSNNNLVGIMKLSLLDCICDGKHKYLINQVSHIYKRFAIKQEDRKERMIEFYKNMWRVIKFYLVNHGHLPLIINGDQMPLHLLESSKMKTLNMKNQDCYVKENYMHSRQRLTMFTQVCSEPGVYLAPHFVLKGAGKKVSVDNPPDGVLVQWSKSGSYSLEEMLKTISHLPNRSNLFSRQTGKGYAIYVLDDYR